MHVNQKTMQKCYIASLQLLAPRFHHSSNNITKYHPQSELKAEDLNLRVEDEDCVKIVGDNKSLPAMSRKSLKIRTTIFEQEQEMLATVLKDNISHSPR